MRKLLISILLASAAAATPALANPDEPSSRQQARGERQQAREQARSERREAREQMRSERSQGPTEVRGGSNDGPSVRSFGGGDRPEVSPVRVESDSSGGGQSRRGDRLRTAVNPDQGQPDSGERRTNWRRRMVESGSGGGEPVRGVESGTEDSSTSGGGERRGFWRERIREVGNGGTDSGPIGGSGGLVQPERPLPRVLRPRTPTPVVSDTPREGTQPPLRTETRRTSHHRWSGDWRRDRRYDWWNWRHRHRSRFHLGFYFDPFGWSYRRYLIGWRFWPSYYSSRYWLHDPWYYRLPYAPPGYRWIRYYDDAILVDTWDGRVVDVIYNFFW